MLYRPTANGTCFLFCFTVPAFVCTVFLSVFATGQETEPASPTDDAEFYRAKEIQTIHLRVDETEMQRMVAALPQRIYVRASFRWRDTTIGNVAIRFKGNSSSDPNQRHKRSYLIKFDEYENGQQFLGLRRVSLDNGVQFGSLFSEPIITEILRDQGIKTHRCNYAKLFVNDEYQGVYVNVERIDETFIQHHLEAPNGMLFKVDEGGPAGNLQFIGDDWEQYSRTFEPENKSAKNGQQRLVKFLRGIQETEAARFPQWLESELELEEFLRISAVMLLSGAFDQLTGWNPHNYYLYFDNEHQKWHYMPWDLDVGFSETAFGQIKVLKDWNAAWPVAGQMPHPLMDRIVSDPVLLKRFRAIEQEILDKYFEPEKLCKLIDEKYAMIQGDLLADPFPHQRLTNPEDRNYEGIVASIKQFVRKRYALASEQLKTPGQRPRMSTPPRGPQPQLAVKVQRVMQAAQAKQLKGEDVTPIQKIMQRVGPLLQQGKAVEAEKLIDEALKAAGVD